MPTLRMPDERYDRDRSVSMTWLTGNVDPTGWLGEPAETVVSLDVRHVRDRKAYVATLTRAKRSGGWERHTAGDGVLVCSVPCARYSAKGLAEAVDGALRVVQRYTDGGLLAELVALANREPVAA